jgi:hypothetical protein
LKVRDINVYIDITFDEIFNLINLFIEIESDNIEELQELALAFEYSMDRLEMNMRALRDKLNEP